MHIIMIHSERSRCGKDYAAAKIVQVLAQKGYSVKQFAIARQLKLFCHKYFNTKEVWSYEVEPGLRKIPLKGLNVTNVVDLWIKVGEFFRGLNPNFWIEQCYADIRRSGVDIAVISDFRFDGEYRYFKNLQIEQRLGQPTVTVLKIEVAAGKGVLNASDGKVSIPYDYAVQNNFDIAFKDRINEFCNAFITMVERNRING